MASYSYCIGVSFALAGTVAIAGSTTVTGTATSFDTQLVSGDYLTIAGETRIVDTVSDATHLTVTVAYTGTAIAVAGARVRLVNVETLGVPAPRTRFIAYSTPITLGDGSTRGAGWRQVEWRWGYISRAGRVALRAYCAGASAAVYIKTQTNEDTTTDTYGIYSAQMLWPQSEDKSAGRRLDFALQFRALVNFP